MAKFQNLNNIADRAMARMDEMGDATIQAMCNTPEAKARQAAMSAKLAASAKRSAMKAEKAKAASIAQATTLTIGQTVRHVRGLFAAAVVTGIEGSTISLDNGKRFSVSALIAD